MNEENRIGSRLKLLRKTLRLNQKDFGNFLGKSQAAVSAVELDLSEINESWILLAKSIFNVNPEWLRDGIGEMGQISLPDEHQAAKVKQPASHAVNRGSIPLGTTNQQKPVEAVFSRAFSLSFHLKSQKRKVLLFAVFDVVLPCFFWTFFVIL